MFYFKLYDYILTAVIETQFDLAQVPNVFLNNCLERIWFFYYLTVD